MAAEKKIAEGNACIYEAEKYLKTSLFKWKPDYDSAATEYSKAVKVHDLVTHGTFSSVVQEENLKCNYSVSATNFRAAKVLDQCKDCLLKAAECYSQNHSYFSSAKSYEQAGLVCKEMEDYMGAIKMIERASQMFREHGTPDTAALSLEKGAKMVESKYPEIACELFKKATEVVMIEDRPRQAAEYASKATRLLVKLKKYDEAAEMLKKEMQYYIMAENTRAAGRLVVAQVLLHLTREDYVAADKAFKEGSSFVEREELNTLVELLEGYDQGDADQMNHALAHPFIKHMDVEYARMARALQTAIGAGSGLGSCTDAPEKSSGTSPRTGNASGNQGQDDDDDYSGGLL